MGVSWRLRGVVPRWLGRVLTFRSAGVSWGSYKRQARARIRARVEAKDDSGTRRVNDQLDTDLDDAVEKDHPAVRRCARGHVDTWRRSARTSWPAPVRFGVCPVAGCGCAEFRQKGGEE
jgi:hypothetical protein